MASSKARIEGVFFFFLIKVYIPLGEGLGGHVPLEMTVKNTEHGPMVTPSHILFLGSLTRNRTVEHFMKFGSLQHFLMSQYTVMSNPKVFFSSPFILKTQ